MSSKRICPFEGDLTPQMKVHVGIDQAADIAARNEEMKRIYGEEVMWMNQNNAL